MDVKLYSYFRSSASYRVRIALYLKGIAFEYVPVHLLKEGGQQLSDSYLKLNPFAEVPTLIHHKKIIGQSMAIIDYIDRTWPSPALFPQEPFERARVIQLCEGVNCSIQPLQNLRVLNFLTDQMKVSAEDKNNWARHWIKKGFVALERLLLQTSGTYCMGGKVTAADLFLIPQVATAKRFNVDLVDFPIIQRVNDNCLKLEAFQKAAPERQPDGL